MNEYRARELVVSSSALELGLRDEILAGVWSRCGFGWVCIALGRNYVLFDHGETLTLCFDGQLMRLPMLAIEDSSCPTTSPSSPDAGLSDELPSQPSL